MEIYYIVGSFILADIITGILQALQKGDLNSTKLREGLFHKLSEILAVGLGAGLELACDYIQLGVDIPLLNVIAVYICIMELVSVLENLCEMNPALAKLFKPYLEKLNKPKEE